MESTTAIAIGNRSMGVQAPQLSIRCYDNEVPAFVRAEIETLYENVYSSVAKLQIYGVLDGASTYVARRDGRPVAIFLFRHDGRTVRVLNELIAIEDENLNQFAATIFTTYPTVSAISFRSIHLQIDQLWYRHQWFNHAEDIVITLPATVEDYTKRLGKPTRRTLRSYTGKLMSNAPSFQLTWFEKEQVSEKDVLEIIRIHRERMRLKNRTCDIDDGEAQRIVRMVRAYGMVGIATIDGRICGGTIAYTCGKNCFIAVNAHCPAYDAFKLGTLCSYFAICECIARGGTQCHFLGGQYEYKFLLLAVQHNLDNLTLYRSSVHLVLNADRVLKTAVEGNVRRATVWMHNGMRQHRRLPKLVFATVKAVRNVNRSAAGFFSQRN